MMAPGTGALALLSKAGVDDGLRDAELALGRAEPLVVLPRRQREAQGLDGALAVARLPRARLRACLLLVGVDRGMEEALYAS